MRQDHRNRLPDPDLELRVGDALLIAADSAEAIQETAALLGRLDPGPHREGSRRPLLPALLRLQGQPHRQQARRDPDAARHRDPHPPCPPLRRGPRALARPDAGDRRPRRRAGAGGPDRRGARAFRRHGEVGGRVLLRLGRLRHGARRAARPGADPDPGRGHGHARHRRRAADRGADPRAAAAHRPDHLGHAAAGQHRAAQFRPDAVPGGGRHQFGPGLRHHRRHAGAADAADRRRRAADHRRDRAARRPLRAEAAL